MSDSLKPETDKEPPRRSGLKRNIVVLVLIALALILLPYLFLRLTIANRKLVRCVYPGAGEAKHPFGHLEHRSRTRFGEQ